MNAGYLIPDDKNLGIVSGYLERPEYESGYILDGFPRTVRAMNKEIQTGFQFS